MEPRSLLGRRHTRWLCKYPYGPRRTVLIIARAHAHRMQHFGIAPAGFEQSLRLATPKLNRGLGWHTRGKFRCQGKNHQDKRAAKPSYPDQRMKQETDPHIEGHPGQVKHGRRPRAAHIAADLIEIPHRLQPIATAARFEGSRATRS